MPKSQLSLLEFQAQYGTNDQCLETIKQLRFPDYSPCPSCATPQKFYRIKGRTSYACGGCRFHIYPLAETIFEKSTTPLQLWFFAMYLMTQTRSGTSAKQLERMLGVTYKTAWRMFKQIRMLMAQGGLPLEGDVEIDEAFMGGDAENRAYVQYDRTKTKEIVMGMMQRGGKAYFKRIKSTGKWALIEQIQAHVKPGARLLTDDYSGYVQVKHYGYKHESVRHSRAEYVRGDVHTNTVEGFWSGLKRGVYGVYRHVSPKYLQAYVDEYAFRYNNRKNPIMFNVLLGNVTSVRALTEAKIALLKKENPF